MSYLLELDSHVSAVAWHGDSVAPGDDKGALQNRCQPARAEMLSSLAARGSYTPKPPHERTKRCRGIPPELCLTATADSGVKQRGNLSCWIFRSIYDDRRMHYEVRAIKLTHNFSQH
jgi:hypothetical protein